MTATVGGDVSGLDFKLTPVPTVRVTGTVKDSSGKPVTTMALRIQRVGGPSGEVRAFYLSETGSFFANAVTPGDYWLSASVLNAAKTPEFSLQRVTIGNMPASFDLVTAPGAAVHGARRSGRQRRAASGQPVGHGVRNRSRTRRAAAARGQPPIAAPSAEMARSCFRICRMRGWFGSRICLRAGWSPAWCSRRRTSAMRRLRFPPALRPAPARDPHRRDRRSPPISR
jgi:hypothetical protein